MIGKDDTNDTKPHVVVVGGGIIGSWSTWLLCHLARYNKEIGKNRQISELIYTKCFRMDLLKVTLVDSGHNIRGSWGDTRALHATMEDDVRIKVET